jgi:hypothetical protein
MISLSIDNFSVLGYDEFERNFVPRKPKSKIKKDEVLRKDFVLCVAAIPQN